jgi:hypothetical protein
MATIELNKLKETILLSLLGLAPQPYGVAILGEVERLTQRSPNLVVFYSTPEKLERKGMIISWLGTATAERGWQRKKHFSETLYGQKITSSLIQKQI